MQNRYYYLILVIVIIFLMTCLWWVWHESNEMEDTMDESEIPVAEQYFPVVLKYPIQVTYLPPGRYFAAYPYQGEEDRADALAEARWVNKVTPPYPQRPLHPLPAGNRGAIGFVVQGTQGQITRSTRPPYPVPLQQPSSSTSRCSRSSNNPSCPYPTEQVQLTELGDTTIPVADNPHLFVPKYPIQQPLPVTDATQEKSLAVCPYPLYPVPSVPGLEEKPLAVLPIKLAKSEAKETSVR